MPSLAPYRHHYTLQHHGIDVDWDDPAVVHAVCAVLEYFGAQPQHAATPASPAVRLSFRTRGPAPAPPPDAVHVAEHNGITVRRADSCIYLSEGASLMQLDLSSGEGRGLLRPPLWRRPGVLRLEVVNLVIHSLLTPLRRHGLYPLHAAALVKDDLGVVLAAESNSGKSTLAYALVRQGWHYLSDDSLLLHVLDAHVEAWPLRRDFGLDAEAERRFPEMAGHWQPFLTEEHKRRVCMNTLYPNQSAERCVPRVLLFPRIVPQPHSRLVPFSKSDALLRLIQQSILLTLEPQTATAHLEALRRLVAQTTTYELLAGRDLKHEPERLAEMLHTLPIDEPSPAVSPSEPVNP